MDNKKFLTSAEARQQFGVDAETLNRLVEAGELRALADRGDWKYRRDELQRLADSGRLGPKAPSFSDAPTAAEELMFLELDEDALFQAAAENEKPPASMPPGDDALTKEIELESASKTPVRKPTDSSSSDVKVVPAGEHSTDSDVALADSGIDSSVVANMTPKDHAEMAQSLSDFDQTSADSPVPGNLSSVVLGQSHRSDPKIPDSDSDVKVISPDHLGLKKSDSDVSVVPDSPMARSSDSDVTVVADRKLTPGGSDSDVKVVTSSTPAGDMLTGKTDDLAAIPDSGIVLGDSGIDSGITLESSGILIEDSSTVQGRGGKTEILDSGISLLPQDSGISLEPADSGLSLESSSVVVSGGTESVEDDSGITLGSEDSGLSLESAADSGISLEPDSGIRLDDQDSGITLTPVDRPLEAVDLDETQPEFDNMEFSDEFPGKESSSGVGTAEIEEVDEEDARETLPPPKSGKRSAVTGLSGAMNATEVEDLEISEDLDAAEFASDELEAAEFESAEFEVEDELEPVDDILEAGDEAFGTSEPDLVTDDEEEVTSTPSVRMAPQEPSWGMAAHLPIIASSVLLLVNALVLWGGVVTMWSGDEPPAIAGSIVRALGGLL